MLTLQKLEQEIIILPENDYSTLRKWFYERDFEKWDNKITKDSESGKLDFLIEEALLE